MYTLSCKLPHQTCLTPQRKTHKHRSIASLFVSDDEMMMMSSSIKIMEYDARNGLVANLLRKEIFSSRSHTYVPTYATYLQGNLCAIMYQSIFNFKKNKYFLCSL